MFSTTVIPTVQRPTLARAVRSVLDQTDSGDLEVIVVNDSGTALEAASWMDDRRVRITHTQGQERSAARNAGARLARGRYLHFLDDDDVMLPGGWQAFLDMERTAGPAKWRYGYWRVVDNEGRLLAEFHPGLRGNAFAALVAGEGLPLQASLIAATLFHQVHGFDIDPELIGVEDRDLQRRLALIGDIELVPSVIAAVRVGRHGSTTPWASTAERDRRSRHYALSQPDALARARQSAGTPYWRGRLTRAYGASGVWNLTRGQVATGARQLAAAIAVAAGGWPGPDFVRGVTHRFTALLPD